MAITQLPSEGWIGGERPSTGAPLPASLVPGGAHDSAGFPWKGRTFDHHGTAFADDNGQTPEAYREGVRAIRKSHEALRGATDNPQPHLDALAKSHARATAICHAERFLVPLIAEAGELGLTPEGKIVEKTQELSIVTVSAPDGRTAMPIFSSVAAMQRWNSTARPIPVPGPQVAVAAAQEGTDLVIIDPGSEDTELVLRRTVLEAFALGNEHAPAWAVPEVVAEFERLSSGEPDVGTVIVVPGDPEARLQGPEVTLVVPVAPGLDKGELHELVARLQAAWATSEIIASRVDSLAVRITAASR